MSEHVWRQKFSVDPVREWMRRDLPGSRDGLVIIDLDYAVRRYGKNYGIDASGDLMLIEKKEFSGLVTGGQTWIYGWIKDAISSSKKADRWRGNHVLRVVYQIEDPICNGCGQPIQNDVEAAYQKFLQAELKWDGKEISRDEFKMLITGNSCPPPLPKSML